MAKVTLQVDVKREQVDKLQADINKLNNTTISIKTQEFTKGMDAAAKSTEEVNSNLEKTVKVFDSSGNLQKNVREYKTGLAETTQVTEKLNKETEEMEHTSTKVTRNIAKEKKLAAQMEKQAAKEAERAQREHAKAEKEAAAQTKEYADAAKKASGLTDMLGRSFSSFLGRMVMYRTVYAGIRQVVNGVTDALRTMKEVDDGLVTVRKVTGFSDAQMANVEQQAYAVASKYGAQASDYVEGVASFARAGYKELSGQLAELSQKTQIVGDTTAEVANQFLLSVDAAYKYNGSITELSKVLDGMNELDNNFATSIEKIAEGMGIVAPVAAQMHVGIDELAASIGTITAVTQRSGKLFLAA